MISFQVPPLIYLDYIMNEGYQNSQKSVLYKGEAKLFNIKKKFSTLKSAPLLYRVHTTKSFSRTEFWTGVG